MPKKHETVQIAPGVIYKKILSQYALGVQSKKKLMPGFPHEVLLKKIKIHDVSFELGLHKDHYVSTLLLIKPPTPEELEKDPNKTGIIFWLKSGRIDGFVEKTFKNVLIAEMPAKTQKSPEAMYAISILTGEIAKYMMSESIGCGKDIPIEEISTLDELKQVNISVGNVPSYI